MTETILDMKYKLPHKPVMLNEVLEYLSPKNNEVYIDATFGAGGYSRAILEKADCIVYGIDRDKSVKNYADILTEKYPNKFYFINNAFNQLESIVFQNKISIINGIVFDVGVSSMQLEKGERGFSFAKEAILDMRMDQSDSNIKTAKEIVNHFSEKELADIIYHYGGERKARKIARLITNARKTAEINTTTQLAEIISQGVTQYNDKIHPATRTFQALRIAVNDELNQLKTALIHAAKYISVGGKILVVTFHSLEDKIVKEHFNKLCGKTPNANRFSPEIGVKQQTANFELLFRGALQVSDTETRHNPRARSAKLRAIRRVR